MGNLIEVDEGEQLDVKRGFCNLYNLSSVKRGVVAGITYKAVGQCPELLGGASGLSVPSVHLVADCVSSNGTCSCQPPER